MSARLTLVQLWDNTVILFFVNMVAVGALVLAGVAVHAALPMGPLSVFVVVLAAACVLAHLLLVSGAFLDQLLSGAFPEEPFRPVRESERLAPFALVSGGSVLCCVALALLASTNQSGGAGGLARLVISVWLAIFCLQVMLAAGTRIACGAQMLPALICEARSALLRPGYAFTNLALALALIATGAIGFPGIGGAFVALRSRAGLDRENEGRSAEGLTALSLAFPWKR